MKVEFINPFVNAALDVLKQEIAAEITRGKMSLEESSVITEDDITVMIGVTGQLSGVVMYSITERTAKNMVAKMLGQPVPVFDDMVESAIAELGNVISGLASAQLEINGYICEIVPPTVVVGRGTIISTVNIKKLVIPLETQYGNLRIAVGLKEKV